MPGRPQRFRRRGGRLNGVQRDRGDLLRFVTPGDALYTNNGDGLERACSRVS